jgi:hypothetical protein
VRGVRTSNNDRCIPTSQHFLDRNVCQLDEIARVELLLKGAHVNQVVLHSVPLGPCGLGSADIEALVDLLVPQPHW